MSHKSYSEAEPTDDEVIALLEELYPDDVTACGMKFSQSYILKQLDRVAFDMFASDTMNWYKCDICDKVHKSDDAEEEARECCQSYCEECGTALPEDEFDNSLCQSCQEQEDEEEA